MKRTLLTFIMAALAPVVWSQDQRVKQSIPAKEYHVLLVPQHPRGGLARVVGRIPNSENMEIHAVADGMQSDKSITLTGNAVVTVSVNGKASATYEGDELILTPVAVAAKPLDHQDVSAKLKAFDAAAVKRDAKAVAQFFAEDAKITVETLSATSVQTKSFSREEYADHLTKLFPNALRISVQDHFTSDSHEQSENPGYGMILAKDGVTATGKYNVRYVIAMPEGQIHWRLNRKLTVEQRGAAFVITSLEVTLPGAVKENWPEPTKDQFGRPLQAPRVPLSR